MNAAGEGASLGEIAAWLPCCSGPVMTTGSRLHFEGCASASSSELLEIAALIERASRELIAWSDKLRVLGRRLDRGEL